MFASPVELGPNFNHKINKQPMKLHISINDCPINISCNGH